MARRKKVPKPYGFVKIEPLESSDRQAPRGHQRYQPGTVSGRLEATMIVATPLHVSSGQFKIGDGQAPPLVKELTRVNGQPCIPASTLKGVVRSVTEAITKSCLRITDSHKKWGKWRKNRLKHPAGTKGCSDPDNLCLACRMFGALGFEGHIRFDDAILTGGNVDIEYMPALWEPAKKGADPYMNGRNPKGRKFYKHGKPVLDGETPTEVLAPKSDLSVVIRFENLTKGELGVLLTSLGVGEPAFVLKYGGGKPVCYGSTMTNLDRLEVWENPKMLYTAYGIEPVERSEETYLKAAEDLLLDDQIESLAAIWRDDMRRNCPEGNY